MARVDYVVPEHASERTRDMLNKNGNKNIFRMLGHSESHRQLLPAGGYDSPPWRVGSGVTRAGDNPGRHSVRGRL